MNGIITIARRELLALFVSPLAWAVLAIVQFIVAWGFLVQVDVFTGLESRLAALEAPPGVTDLVVAPTFSNISLVLLMITPLLTMRLLAGERRSGSLQLLRAAPISSLQVVLGKFIGVYLFMLLLLAMLALMPLALLLGTSLDIGMFASGLLGLLLLSAMLVAAGLYLSSLTGQPAVAATASFGLFLLLWLLNAGGQADAAVHFIAIGGHLRALVQGVFSTGDVGYFLVATLLFLSLAVQRLDAERVQR